MELVIFLAAGTGLMLVLMLHLRKYYQITYIKTVVLAVLLTLAGLSGTKIMYWLESGSWGGESFFGAILLVPLLMLLASGILQIPVGTILDMCAPAECIMLALMKVRCSYFGCCKGRILHITENLEFRFPSQLVEMLSALILMYILLRIIKKDKHRNQIYACYMILYGISRFILNLFRLTVPFVWIIPAGNFWSLISIVLGIIWFFLVKKNKKNIIDTYRDNDN